MQAGVQKRKCVFAGSFDPPTIGHKAMIEDCLALFDEAVVAVMVNPGKRPCFLPEERVEMLRRMFPDEPRIRVMTFGGTAAELLRKENTRIYVRGVRSAVDFEYENADFFASAKLDPDILPVYLPCRQELLHVTSTAARACLRFSAPTDAFLTPEVRAYIDGLREKRL